MNTKSLSKILSTILNVLTVAVIALPAVLIFPLTSDAITFPKHLFIILAAFAALTAWTLGFIFRKKVTATISPLLLPIFLLAAASIASIIFGASPFPEALLGQTGLSIAFLILFLAGSSRPKKVSGWISGGLIASAAAVALINLLSYLGILSNLGFLGDLGKMFTPTGGLITHLIFLAAVLPLAFGVLKRPGLAGQGQALNDSSSTIRALKQLCSLAAIVLIIGGVIIGGANYLKNRAAFRQLPLSTGWQIAVEALKISPFVGVGSNGYLAAFTQYRPISANNGDLWNIRFQQASNELLQRFTENGILGLAALLLLIYAAYKTYKTYKSYVPSGLGASLAIFGIGLFLEPLNAVALSLLLGLLLIMVLSAKGQTAAYDKTSIYDVILGIVTFRKGIVSVNLVPPSAAGDLAATPISKPAEKASLSSILGWVLFVPAAAISILVFYFGSRVLAAEIDYRQALVGIAANDGTTAYNKLISTITKNPWFDTYHRQYADINLRLANSLAAQKNLSDTDRNNVSQLIQQSFREGKIAIQLDPGDVRNWEQLAVIYRALINVADGSKDWTITAYSEAIRRDPINPLLRLDLGGVFYSLKDWDNAIRTFQTAVSLKPDYANAYYNLALALEQAGKLTDAAKAMQAAVQNLDAKSPDYEAAVAKFEELAKKAKEESGIRNQETMGTSKEPLTKPQPLPTAGPGANKVDLTPKEAPPVTPTPRPEDDQSLAGTPTPTP